MGPSNSPSCFSFATSAAGIDTWSPAWKVDPHGDRFARFRDACTVKTRRGQLLPFDIGGHRVGCFNSGLVYAEGHPAGAGELCPPDELLVRGIELQEALRAAGVPITGREMAFGEMSSESEGFAGLRRQDATLDVAAGGSSAGLALLSGVASVVRESPGCEVVHFGRDRGVETVYLVGYGGKTRLARVYDKATESAVAPRGTVIRFEDQRRWSKDDRPSPAEMTGDYVRFKFQRRFVSLYRASKGVTVGGPMVVVERLWDAVDAGEITARQAEKLAGHAVMSARRATPLHSRYTEWRRRRELQELGLVLGDGLLEEVEVNVHDVLEMALESDAWTRRG
jgi:hypothetical protein